MNNLSLVSFLVNKYLTGTVNHTTLRIMAYIAVISIAITTFTLSLQLFIAQGFETALIEKMQNIYPDLLISAPTNQSFNWETIDTSLKQTFPDVFKTAPRHEKRALLKTDHPFTQSIITLQALDPILEKQVTVIQKRIIEHIPLEKILTHNTVIIGKNIATDHHLTTGDTITLLVQDDTEAEITENDFTKITCIVGGIIETGIYHYDAGLVLCSFDLMHETLDDPTISFISVKLHNNTNTLTILKKIEKQFSYTVDCWQTLYPSLLAASQLEKYVGIVLLSLMALVACTTITAFIFMQIILKKRDIALLKINGFTDSSIAYVFITIGMILTTIACSIGLSCALLVGLFLQKYKLFSLPDVYDVTHIPVTITPFSIFFIILLILMLGFISTLLAVYHIKTINPSHTLRFEV